MLWADINGMLQMYTQPLKMILFILVMIPYLQFTNGMTGRYRD